MSKTTEQLIDILKAGGSISIDITARPYAHLMRLAEASSGTGSTLIFRNSQERASQQLIELSKYNTSNNIIFSVD
ncbi:hypothetical protein [Leclercia adecarboxylata]|uniref:hypothetical protein n=1 Tax=Leclercia adecarboxylata TaxID=83655 RepID=UPI00254D4286|nr:hypothetical protein [Leclercia adecarboxylata]